MGSCWGSGDTVGGGEWIMSGSGIGEIDGGSEGVSSVSSESVSGVSSSSMIVVPLNLVFEPSSAVASGFTVCSVSL